MGDEQPNGHDAVANVRDVNHEMIALARGSRGLTQEELADALSFSQSKMSKYEHGLIAVSPEDLEKLSAYLEFPAEFFLQRDDVVGFGSCCAYHRKQKSLPARELAVIHDKLNVCGLHISKLLTAVTIESHNAFPRMDIDEHHGSAETIAQLVRGAWGLPLGPVRNLASAIETAGGIVMCVDFGTSKLDAVSLWPRKMPPLFFVNREIPVDRWRFTLAHELGHLVMHRIPTPNAEVEADRFASEFLMPAREIASDMEDMSIAKAARLKPFWRVSMQALIRRARDLGKITPRHYTTLQSQIIANGYRKDEPVTIKPELPTVISDLIAVHLRDLGFTIAEVSRAALSDERHFRRLFLCDQQPRFAVVG